ncbi:HD domain-containing protein [Trichocoleus sp. FACHB-591]|uniref:HD domain-containing protein n=1 Tax=Trichocoleus sp. FACHB-591 TaxID=2692872 RepID=UPI0016867D2D|nr:HD domain-containing protein [Trichocoleus sp. FACHB-591]MBD2095502.1 HD domain-containing protein [Trichocoleus sp. FACHB-591]
MESQQAGLIWQALDFAARKHRDQRRKDLEASPYINHPISLVNLLWNTGGVTDPAVIMAALLHDTVEDTATTFAELAQEFGEEVQQLVKEVTDDKSLPKQERKQQQVEHAAHLSDKAKLVKLADKISNLRDIIASPPADWSYDRQREYFVWAKQVVDQMRGNHAPLEAVFDQVYQQGISQLSDR